jgi:signal recognition particle subunit SRP54
MAKRMAKNQFTLEDMRKQFQQVQKLGSMSKIMGMLPGVTKEMKDQMASAATDKRVKHLEAIINSMTAAERANHNLLDGKRKRRISTGSGRPVSEINQLLKQYVEAKKMMGQMNDPKFMARMQRMAKMGGGPNLPFK